MTVSALNSAQREAVEHPGGPLLVVAGAGSGKTRVLTARVAWLLEHGESPGRVLAFTFTNRAAREMRERIHARVGAGAERVWIGTFHATAVRLLRREARAAGIPPDFSIYDREDQETVLRDVMRELAVPEGTLKLGALLHRISDAKNALVGPAELERLAVSPQEQRIARAYTEYQRRLRANGALDFDDLIAEAVRLLADTPEGAAYAERFRHVLVDEYQDTNHAQFRLVATLASVHKNLFVVGDDDQSIYGWRGANLANVLEFEQSFPGAAVVRLEQNYRSTGNILKAANAVIAHNRARKGKTLWCDREDGARLSFTLAADEIDEARRVRALLAALVRDGGSLKDAAVLYRTNAQSRALETELRQGGMAYELVGGISFYHRREVKDVVAYLRLAVQPEDAVAFWRIWNTPRRGLGPSVRLAVEERMVRDGVSPLAALRSLAAEGALARAARTGAAELLGLLDELVQRRVDPVDTLFALTLERSRYLGTLEGEDDESERRANVQELGVAASEFAALGRGGLAEFLAETALLTDVDRLGEASDRVLLLTAHNAKGLEFPIVIVTGMEEGLLPHASSIPDDERLEEERRLFYVAVTRAQQRVHLFAAAYRRRFDAPSGGAVSRFIGEIPFDLLEREESAAAQTRSWGTHAGARRASGWGETLQVTARRARNRAQGRQVWHETFGRGVVVDAEGDGPGAKYTVQFPDGLRKVLGRFLEGGDDGAVA